MHIVAVVVMLVGGCVWSHGHPRTHMYARAHAHRSTGPECCPRPAFPQPWRRLLDKVIRRGKGGVPFAQVVESLIPPPPPPPILRAAPRQAAEDRYVGQGELLAMWKSPIPDLTVPLRGSPRVCTMKNAE